METNKVSIIMATYNRAHFIVETLESILKQTYSNWECIIIDDGGTDNTAEVIQSFLENDNRFSFFKRPNTCKKGLPGSRNYGIAKATGDYIIFFDDDDIVHPQLLKFCVNEFNKDFQIDFVHYKKKSFQNDFNYSELTTDLNYKITKLNSNLDEDVITSVLALASCTVLWKAVLIQENLFNENLMYAEEWECYSRILIQNNLIGLKINKALYFNRKHPNSNTGEFWNNDPVRLTSKKEAIFFVANNLVSSNKLSKKLKNYLLNKAINFRDFNLLKRLFQVFCISIQEKLFYLLKFSCFPIWLKYKVYSK